MPHKHSTKDTKHGKHGKHCKHEKHDKNMTHASLPNFIKEKKQLKDIIGERPCNKCVFDETSLYSSDTNMDLNKNIDGQLNISNLDVNHQNKNIAVCNSYPLGNLGYNFPNPSYSVQVIRRPDDNKYFHNYKYNYNAQVNKPVMTYDNYITQRALKNMTPAECRYYAKMNEKYYYFNGNYDVPGDKQNIVELQAMLNYPMYMGGPAVGEINGQMGYNQQSGNSYPSKPIVNSNDVTGLNSNGIQIYANSPEYYGVQAKTLPGQNLSYRNPNNTPNPRTGYNPAYSNYGQYYY
jgi:hypothetical protein